MTYVQYYTSGWNGALVEECGDRGVVILDGRKCLDNLHHDAVAMNNFRRPYYAAYRICKGSGFMDGKPTTPLYFLVPQGEPTP